ncbi:MAG: flagellar biosynthetic protein FliR [Treponemataceae bacterium]|nr:flagellar biosynthetic protein FliR [Treponemataceae bacterium]
MLQTIVAAAPLFLLIAVRIFAIMQTSPLLSSQMVPRVAKVGLTGCIAFLVLPVLMNDSSLNSYFQQGANVNLGSSGVVNSVFQDPFTLQYVFLLMGEAMIGVIMGFFLNLLFGAFSSAGQFFSLQMGFSAAEAYDALSQVENPLMGQYLNLLAMLVFLQIDGFKELFLHGVVHSFTALNAYTLVFARSQFMTFLLKGLTGLFFNAMVISMPMVGTLFLVHAAMGLLSRAAPQMNLLSDSMPITLLSSFVLLVLVLPGMCNLFGGLMNAGFTALYGTFASLAPGGGL